MRREVYEVTAYHPELVMDTSMIEQIMEVMLEYDLIERSP